MTISGITQTYASFSAMRLTINVSTPQPAAQPKTGTATLSDTVSLSPEATATPTASDDALPTPPVTGTPTPAPGTPAPPDRAGALFAALDADQDGSVTEDEFKAGAKQILSQGRRPRRAEREDDDHGHGDHHVHEGRGSRRLDRKLDKLFDRIDANGDGSLDKTELTEALAAADKRREPPPPPQGPDPAADPATGQGASTGTVMTFTMTFVSIAVKRYTSLQGDATTTGSSTPGATTPATTPATDTPNTPAVEPPLAA